MALVTSKECVVGITDTATDTTAKHDWVTLLLLLTLVTSKVSDISIVDTIPDTTPSTTPNKMH